MKRLTKFPHRLKLLYLLYRLGRFREHSSSNLPQPNPNLIPSTDKGLRTLPTHFYSPTKKKILIWTRNNIPQNFGTAVVPDCWIYFLPEWPRIYKNTYYKCTLLPGISVIVDKIQLSQFVHIIINLAIVQKSDTFNSNPIFYVLGWDALPTIQIWSQLLVVCAQQPTDRRKNNGFGKQQGISSMEIAIISSQKLFSRFTSIGK